MKDISMTDTAFTTAEVSQPPATEEVRSILQNRVSWGAIFAGVVVALITQVLLTMLGAGIGIATLDPGTGENPAASTFSIAAGIWYMLSGIISAFAGGYIAARLSGKTVPTTGALHGLTTWALTTLLVLWFLTSTVGALVGGVFSGVASAVGGVGHTVAQAAGPMLAEANPLDAIDAQVRATGTDPEALNASAVSAVRKLVTSSEGNAGPAREQAAQALAKARGIPVDQATQQVAAMEKQFRDTLTAAKQQATDAAKATASAVSTGAISAFIALVLGAIASWLGGRSGVVHPVYADRVIPSRRPLGRLEQAQI